MNDFYNFFQSAKLDVDMAAYLDIGTEWKHMVSAFQYVRIYYIRSGSAWLTLTDGILPLEEGYMYFIPAFSILNGTCDHHLGHYFIHIIPDLVTEHFLKLLPLQHRIKMDRDTADYLFCLLSKTFNQRSFILNSPWTAS